MKKFYFISLLLISLILNNKNSFAQFVNPAIYADITAANGFNGTENTGNDVREFQDLDLDMQIMCWDGDITAFAWNDQVNVSTGVLNLAGMQLGRAWDPDIVLFEDNQLMFTLIVYLIDNDVYYESWQYNSGALTWNLATPPTQLTTGGVSLCPNVDVDEFGKTVVVWSENNQVFSSAGDILGNFNQNVFISDGKRPDVALCVDPVDPPVNITFVCVNGTFRDLSVVETSYLTILTNSPIPLPQILNTCNFAAGENFGKPRIASPKDLILPPNVWEIVVPFRDANNSYFIQGYNYTNLGPEIINVGTLNDLTGTLNYQAAVSYCFGYIIVTWTYDDATYGYTSGTFDVLSRILNYDGSMSATPPTNTFSIVNNYTTGFQGISSVAGRFSVNNEKLVTFYNNNLGEVDYKYRDCNQTQFRLRKPDPETIIDADVYPNPTSGYVNINIVNEFETGKLEVYNIQGQLLLQEEINSQKFELDVSMLNTGIYRLRLITDNISEIKTIEVL